ncbi:MAG: hypothetical protein R3284_05930 [Rubricoccaceae bacterium]|nr:hypothetical protein [Rubricoccaceae bacterium]
MSSSIATTLVLVFVALLIAGGSYYATDVFQKDNLQQLEDSRKVAELTNARVEDLLVREAESEVLAEEALSRWHARYKYIPNDLNTADMLEYVEGLTRSGFEQFDMHLVGRTSSPDFSTYTFEVTGIGTYSAMYHVIWHLENNREFYRINNVSVDHIEHVRRNERTGDESRRDLVSFKFTLLAYFAGIEGISAPQDSLRPIPRMLFAREFPEKDIFDPLVKPPTTSSDQLPPNTEGLLNIEEAELISIVGHVAVFSSGETRFDVQEGDRIYLGTIVEVDPANSLVRARLVKNNHAEMITRRLGDGASYRRALGPIQLDAISTDTPENN